MITDYDIWLRYNSLTEKDCERIRAHIPGLVYKPLFSVIVPVYNVEERWLRKCLDSVLNQLYPYWELCIADDASTKPHIKQVLLEYAGQNPKIKLVFRERNGHISAATNSALNLASGDFVALLDHDDELTPDALYENAVLLNQYPQADMTYSDEDKIDVEGKRHGPYFKPDWSPDMFLSHNYACHFSVFRTKIIREIGGYREGYEGSQDYDLIARFTERSNNIFHISKIIYHWRTIPESTAVNQKAKKYAYIAAFKVIQEALDRRGEGGWVEAMPAYPGHFVVRYRPRGVPLISIIIPIRDKPDLLDKCLKSIFGISAYQNFEIIIVDNGSAENETFRLLSQWSRQEPERLRIVQQNIPFNWAKLNNEAVKVARGQLVLFLNNDTEVISPNWLEEMAGQAMRKSIGAVGAFLLFPDQTIQHAGVILGISCCSHGHRGFHKDAPGYFGRLVGVSNYAAVTGACLMVAKDKFEMAGGFDQEFDRDYNDVDFCLKLCAKGFYNVVLPQVKLIHDESKTRGSYNTEEKRNSHKKAVDIMNGRWGGYIEKDPFYNRFLTRNNIDFSISTRLHKTVGLAQIAETIIEKGSVGNFGSLDLIRVDRDHIIIEGWAINPTLPMPAEEVLIVDQNGNIMANVRVGLPRPNLALALGSKQMLYAGWSTSIDKNLLKQDDCIIRAYLYLSAEKKALRLEGEFNLRLISQPVDLDKYADKVLDNPSGNPGYLDAAILDCGRVFCGGWGRNPETGEPAEEIFVVDSNKKIIAHTFVTEERQDVAKTLKDERMLRCGWNVWFDQNFLGKGSHTLQAYLYLRKSKTAIRLHRERIVDI